MTNATESTYDDRKAIALLRPARTTSLSPSRVSLVLADPGSRR
jgi:hypothetical protein